MTRTLTVLALALVAVPALAQVADPAPGAPPDTLRPGHPAFAAFDLEPGERQYTISLVRPDAREAVGTLVETTTVEGDTVTRVRRTEINGAVTADTSVAVLPDLVPVSTAWGRQGVRHTSADRKRATFAPGRAQTQVGWASGALRDTTLRLDRPVFAGSWTETIVAALPLAEGYTAVFEKLDAEHGRVPVAVRVVGTETAGGAEAWTVEVVQRGHASQVVVDRATREVRLTRAYSSRPAAWTEIVPED